jgi:hypothetical protein
MGRSIPFYFKQNAKRYWLQRIRRMYNKVPINHCENIFKIFQNIFKYISLFHSYIYNKCFLKYTRNDLFEYINDLTSFKAMDAGY